MTSKLAYLEGLGIDPVAAAVYPSPLKRRYDIADYENVHPPYGTLADFDRFIAVAHPRHLRVITELSSTTRLTSIRGSRRRGGRRRDQRPRTLE